MGTFCVDQNIECFRDFKEEEIGLDSAVQLLSFLPLWYSYYQLLCVITFSFGIVCSEVITKKSAWDLENQDYDLDGTFPSHKILFANSEQVTSAKLMLNY